MERRSPEPYPATTDVLGLADAVRRNVALVVEGKDDVVLTAVTVLFAGGHLLVEDVPGVGKTVLAKALARSVDATMRRIQFTPDLLPSDITGVNVYDQGKGDLRSVRARCSRTSSSVTRSTAPLRRRSRRCSKRWRSTR